MINPFKEQSIRKGAEKLTEFLKKNGVKSDYAEIGGNVGLTAAMAALWPTGSYATHKLVESQKDNLSENQQRAIKFTGDLLFGLPILTHAMGRPFIEDINGKEWADAAMSGLSLSIGTAGIAYNNREFMGSAATLGFLFSLAGEIEEYIESKGKTALDELKRIVPSTVMRIVDNTTNSASIESIVEGDILLVRKGETIPVDATLHGNLQSANFVDSNHIFTGDSSHEVTKRAGDIIEQGLTASDDINIQVSKTAEESHVSTIAEKLENEVSSKRHSSIKNIVNKGYVPLMLAAVATQFGFRYYNDSKRHENRANYKDRKVQEAISDANADDSQVAALQKEATEYRLTHGKGHSLQQSIERATDLAIKMAPCAIMAGLLIYPFTRFKLMSDKNIGVNKEVALEDLGKMFTSLKGKTIHSDTNGPLVTRDMRSFNKEHFRFFDACGNPQADKQGKEMLEHLTALQTGGHDIAKGWQRFAEQAHINKTSGDITIEALAERAGRGTKASIKTASGPVEIIAGNRAAISSAGYEIPESVNRNIDALKSSGDLHDVFFTVTKNTEGAIQFGIMPMQVEFNEPAIAAAQKMVKQGTDFTQLTGSSKHLAEAVEQKIKTGLSDAEKARVTFHAELEPQAKADIIHADDNAALFFADDPNDLLAIEAIEKKGGHGIAIGEPTIGATKSKASIVVPGIEHVPDLMELGYKTNKAAPWMVGIPSVYVAGLTGHHLGGTYLYQKDRRERQQMLDEGKTPEEIDSIQVKKTGNWRNLFAKQPSTIVSSILHEAPTVAMASAAALQSGKLLKTLG